ncbi:FimV/HubP family polar landmark protein, partial [Endozoicomonas sp. ALC013]|uniref:FimV/HubP family polar landmark protein n=1 Tax=Endozoicomonas sp. ALC013 TaxID=3403076 RepID=UPI003BB75CBC
REQLDKLSRENAELKSRLKDLDDQIATLKRLVALKDDQMAALQNQSRSLPTQRQAETASPGMMSTLFGNPLIMLLLALIPLGGAGWLFYQRRRKQQEALDDEDVDIQPVNLNKEVPIDASPKPTASPSAEDELKFDEALAIDDSIINEVDADGETAGQTEDPLSEADIYIAYGRLDQAEELLTQAIFNEPGRSDLKLKLVEVHSESGDLEKFNQALADLEATGDPAAMRAAEEFKARFPDAFEGVSAPDEIAGMSDLDLDGLGLDGDEQGLDSLDDLDFDLDDFDLDEEPEAAEQFETSGLDDLDDLDFGVESDDVLARDSQAAFSDEGGSSLEASLDDDLDFLSDGDEVATKLDLARAYMDMGDSEGASAILQEVMEQGSDEQKQEAMLLMQNAGTH